MNALVAIGLLAVAAASGPQVDVRTRLVPPEVPFHRQAEFSIIVEAPAGLDVKLPDMLEKTGGAPVADVRRDTEKIKAGRVRITETYVLDPVFAGKYAIEPVEVIWADDGRAVVPSPGFAVRDLTEAERAAAEEFAENAGPAVPPSVVERYWQWTFVATLALAAVAVLIVWAVWFRKRAKKLAPPPLPWEVAYNRLRELDQRQLPEAGKYEPFYVDLTAILRYYIEDRFHLRAPEQTTQEFLADASTSGAFTPPHQQLLADLLRHSDRVKFAQYVPSVPEMERSFALVLQFVDETVPKPELEPAQPPAEEAA